MPVCSFTIEDIVPDEPSYSGFINANIYASPTSTCGLIASAAHVNVSGYRALVSVVGPDSTSYLQGQLTLDVAALDAAHHLPAAHCDAKGKMWSNLRLFHRGEGYAYLVRRALRDTQLPELKNTPYSLK